MVLAIGEEHEQLADVVASLLADRHAGEAREALEGEAGLPPHWSDAAELGWLGLHLPEQWGGQGYGLFELAIVVSELGRRCAPGPFLPTVVVSALVAELGTDRMREELLTLLADGSLAAGLGLWGHASIHHHLVHGDAGPVLGGDVSRLLAVTVGEDVILLDALDPGVIIGDRAAMDAGRASPPITLADVAVGEDRTLRNGRRRALDIFRALAAAEAAGGARACLDMAAQYAKDRQAFGRPIGQFQAVKHHCANMLVASEMAIAAAWDAARAAADPAEAQLASASAAAIALPAFLDAAKLNVQVHGGIGYTWEHDAHLFLRRATTLGALAGPAAAARQEVARLTSEGAVRTLAVDLPPEAEALRTEVRAFVARYRELDPVSRRNALVEEGYLFPHWPRPWGRGAGAVEQIVIHEEFAEFDRMEGFHVTNWTWPIVLPTIIRHGNDDQRARWVQQTFDGTVRWCQLFSEPDAGSDLASLKTTGVRVEGGWSVTGSKVWTSTAQHANLGFALVRTNPDVPPHQGITCMAIDMDAPGMQVVPLREINGGEMFNQEFLDEVFVPDANVIGEVDRGWAVARTTLDNERVSLGSADEHDELVELAQSVDLTDSSIAMELGTFLAESQTLRLVNLRQATRAVVGGEPGAGGNITKLVHAEHSQRLAEFRARLAGAEGVFDDSPAHGVLASRMATIAGGTSEIIRNTIAERILGLPRDPRPGA